MTVRTTTLERDFPGRRFKIWQYAVSFSQLLIRSERSESRGQSTNIDIIFNGVRFLMVPTLMSSLTLTDPLSMDLAQVTTLMGLGGDADLPGDLFVLTDGENRYYVVAHAARVEKNELDLMESSLMWPAPGSPES